MTRAKVVRGAMSRVIGYQPRAKVITGGLQGPPGSTGPVPALSGFLKLQDQMKATIQTVYDDLDNASALGVSSGAVRVTGEFQIETSIAFNVALYAGYYAGAWMKMTAGQGFEAPSFKATETDPNKYAISSTGFNVFIQGAASKHALLLIAHATATENVFEIQDNLNANVFTVNDRGKVTAYSSILAPVGSAGDPSFQFYGTNSGFFYNASSIKLSLSGSEKYVFNASYMYSGVAGGFMIVNLASSSTQPVFVPNNSSFNTGIGASAAGTVSLICGGTEINRISSTGFSCKSGAITSVNPVRGELYEHTAAGSGTNITLTTGGNWYGWKSATAGNITGGNYVTADVADITADHLTIGSQGAGDYFVTVSCSFKGSTGEIIMGAVFVNGVEQTDIEFHRQLGTAGDVGSASASGILTLAASDEVSLRFSAVNNSKFVEIEACNLSIYRIN